MLRRIVRAVVRAPLVRYRRFMQAEMMDEILLMHKDQKQLTEALNGIEAMLVTLALMKTDMENS